MVTTTYDTVTWKDITQSMTQVSAIWTNGVYHYPHVKGNALYINTRLSHHKKKMSSRRELSSAVSSASSSLNWSLCGGIPNTFPVGCPLPALERIFAVPPTVAGLDLTGVTSLCAGDLREVGREVGSSSRELTISTTDRVFSLQRKTSIIKNMFNIV